MSELLLAGAVVAGLVLLRLANDFVDPEALLAWSAGLLAAGFALGLPAGIGYHVLLWRGLGAVGRRERRWWLRPTRCHDALAAADRRRVLRWFRAGAAGFLLVAAGCALLFVVTMRVAFP
jgi:hypothetical protein